MGASNWLDPCQARTPGDVELGSQQFSLCSVYYADPRQHSITSWFIASFCLLSPSITLATFVIMSLSKTPINELRMVLWSRDIALVAPPDIPAICGVFMTVFGFAIGPRFSTLSRLFRSPAKALVSQRLFHYVVYARYIIYSRYCCYL